MRTVEEVQALLIRAVVPCIVRCYTLSFEIPGQLSSRERRAGLVDPVMQVAIRADPGTPYNVVEQAQQAIIRAVFTGQFKVDDHAAAAYLLPYTSTSTTTTTITTTQLYVDQSSDERSTLSIVIGVVLAAVLLISLCIGIMFLNKHKPLGEVNSPVDIRAKHPTKEGAVEEVYKVPRSLHYFPTDNDVEANYKLPAQFYAKPADVKYGLPAEGKYGLPVGGATSDNALGALMNSMWNDAGKQYRMPSTAGGGLIGGLLGRGRLTPGMVPDPANAAYSTAYSAAPGNSIAEYAGVDALGVAAEPWEPWGGALVSGGFALNKYSTSGARSPPGVLGAFGEDEYLTLMESPGASPKDRSWAAHDAVFSRMDTNRDGVLSQNEFRGGYGNPALAGASPLSPMRPVQKPAPDSFNPLTVGEDQGAFLRTSQHFYPAGEGSLMNPQFNANM